MTEEINIEKFDDYSISHLIPYEHNSKIHTPEQIDRIANSIIEFGFNNPVLCDEANIILAGHGRVLAAEKLGIEKIPVWKIFGLSPEKKMAFRIADNKLGMDTGFDMEALKFDIDALSAVGFDLDSFGLDFKFADLDLKGDREIDTDTTSTTKIETFLNNTIKQIVLYFQTEEYESVLNQLDKIMLEQPDLQNNTEVFNYLLNFHQSATATAQPEKKPE